jgi:hypothetical protein
VSRRKSRGFGIKLADTVSEVAADYLGFLRAGRGEEMEDAKAFAARHAAAKAALAHLEQLIKLAASCDAEAAERLCGCEASLAEARALMPEEAATEEREDEEGGAG